MEYHTVVVPHVTDLTYNAVTRRTAQGCYIRCYTTRPRLLARRRPARLVFGPPNVERFVTVVVVIERFVRGRRRRSRNRSTGDIPAQMPYNTGHTAAYSAHSMRHRPRRPRRLEHGATRGVPRRRTRSYQIPRHGASAIHAGRRSTNPEHVVWMRGFGEFGTEARPTGAAPHRLTRNLLERDDEGRTVGVVEQVRRAAAKPTAEGDLAIANSAFDDMIRCRPRRSVLSISGEPLDNGSDGRERVQVHRPR